jgi:hypothetical protein
MEDQNKDGSKPISSGIQPGPGERLQDAPQQIGASGGASSAAGSSGGIEGDAFSGNGGSNKGAFNTANLKESGARLTAGAKQYAGDMANRVKESGRTMFDQKKETAVGQVDNVANAIRSTASHLQEEGQPQVARYIGMVADQLESFSGRLRDKDLDSLIGDAQNVARRSPTTFFVGAVAAGFVLARFLKSSTDGYEAGLASREGNWRSSGASDSTQMARPSGSASMGADGASAGGAMSANVGASTSAALNGTRTGGGSL